MDYRLVDYRTQDGHSTAFVAEGRKLIAVIAMDSSGIRIRKVPMSEGRYMKPIAYPLRRARNAFLRAGRRFGITDSARAVIKGVA